MQVEQFAILRELVDHAESCLAKLFKLVGLTLIRLIDDVGEELDEGTLDQLLLEA